MTVVVAAAPIVDEVAAALVVDEVAAAVLVVVRNGDDGCINHC